jgi:hypothetical protein
MVYSSSPILASMSDLVRCCGAQIPQLYRCSPSFGIWARLRLPMVSQMVWFTARELQCFLETTPFLTTLRLLYKQGGHSGWVYRGNPGRSNIGIELASLVHAMLAQMGVPTPAIPSAYFSLFRGQQYCDEQAKARSSPADSYALSPSLVRLLNQRVEAVCQDLFSQKSFQDPVLRSLAREFHVVYAMFSSLKMMEHCYAETFCRRRRIVGWQTIERLMTELGSEPRFSQPLGVIPPRSLLMTRITHFYGRMCETARYQILSPSFHVDLECRRQYHAFEKYWELSRAILDRREPPPGLMRRELLQTVW